MKSIKYCFLFICAPALLFAQTSGDSVQTDIQLRTIIESENVPLNREVVYHIELLWQGDLSQYAITSMDEPAVTNLVVRGKGSSNKVTTAQNGKAYASKRITFYYRPMEIGMAYVDGITVRYEDNRTGVEDFLLSGRIGVKIIDPLPEPGENNIFSLLFIILGTALVLVLTFYFYGQYRKRKKEEREKATSDPTESIEEKYIRLLKETIHINTDNVKDGLTDLSHLLNGYFAEKYRLQAVNLSTENLLIALQQNNLSEETLTRVKDFFQQANLVKFAGESVSEGEFHRLYDIVELVLENQKSDFSNQEDK